MWEFRRRGGRLLPTHAEASVITYITQVEECIRLKAIDYARNGEERLWTKCLMDAMHDEANVWQEYHNKLQKRSPGNAGGTAERPRDRSRSGPKKKTDRRERKGG